MNMMIPATSGNSSLDFFRQFFVGADTGLVVLWLKLRTGKSETYSFPVTDLEAVAKANVELADRGDIYFERSLQGVAPSRGRRGSEAGVVQTFSLSNDLDTGEGPHSTPPERLPRDLEEATALVREAGLPEPTLVLHTGGGVHLHWLYTTPFTITNDADRAAEKALAEAWQTRLTPVFKARDYTVDRTFSLEHLFRAPGTMNRKVDKANPSRPAQPVKLMSVGLRLDRAVALASVEPKATRVVGNGKAGGASAMLRERGRQAHIARAKPDNLASVLAGCAWMEHCEADAATLSEPEWYAELSISARCEDGRELSHKLSEPHPGYNYQETEDKIDHALNDTRPVTCSKVANEFGFEGCARCPFSITSPIQLASEPLNLVREQRRAVYILELRRWLNLTTGRFLSPESFGDAIQARVGRLPHSLMMSSKTTARVDAMDYLAGVSQLIVRGKDGVLLVNLWQDTGVKAAQGDPSPVLDYLARFIPDTRSREHVIQYLAHLVQRPSVKIEHGVIIMGGYGTGKGTLRLMMNILFGERNVKKIEGEELSDKNNSDWVNRQVLVFEEAVQSGKFEVYNRTKELVTDEFFRVQNKYIPTYEGRTPRGIFIMSNDAAPIAIPRNDRRWFLCDTPESPETEEELKANAAFFKAFRDRMDSDPALVAAFRHYLMTEVSLETFTVKGAPPVTAAKRRATEESRTPLARVVADLIRSEVPPFNRDVVSAGQVIEAVSRSEWTAVLAQMNMKKVSDALQSAGGFPVNMVDGDHKQVRITRDLVPRLWGIRNKARWRSATTADLRSEWLGGQPAAEAEVVQLHSSGLDRIMRKVRS